MEASFDRLVSNRAEGVSAVGGFHENSTAADAKKRMCEYVFVLFDKPMQL